MINRRHAEALQCYIDFSNEIYISPMPTILVSRFNASCSNDDATTFLQDKNLIAFLKPHRPSQVGSLLPNTLNEEMSRDEIRKALINVQLTEYAMFLQPDSDNLAAKDRIKALIHVDRFLISRYNKVIEL